MESVEHWEIRVLYVLTVSDVAEGNVRGLDFDPRAIITSG